MIVGTDLSDSKTKHTRLYVENSYLRKMFNTDSV